MMNLGVIQGVRINSEGGKEKILSTVWFVDQNCTRNIKLIQLREKNFEVGNFLVKEGYQISDPKEFNHQLRELFLRSILPKHIT